MIPRFAIITTYNRPQMCQQVIKDLGDDVDDIFVIDNGDTVPMPDPSDEFTLPLYGVYPYDLQPVNLSKLWNYGLDLAATAGAAFEQYDVAILNDDLRVPDKWFSRTAAAMRETTAVAACAGRQTILQTKAWPVPLDTRMTGWAFVLRGEAGLRADERFQWWFGDDMIDWTAREMGGMLMVNGPQPLNLLPNGLMTPERHEQSNRDALTFYETWGRRPW